MNYFIGDKAEIRKIMTENDVAAFAEISGDWNPIHLDEEYARKTRFKTRICHGMLTAALISTVLGTKLPGPGGVYLSQSLKFLRPVYIGESITAEVQVTGWDGEKSLLTVNTRCFNEKSQDVLTGEALLLVEPVND